MLHKPMTLLALKYGCNVACEKPLALTYADTKEMFDYAKSVGKVLFACQTLRYNDEYQFAREQFDNGVLGDVYYSEFSLVRRRGVPKWGTFHKKDANGGGAFCDLGVHLVDAALWVMGGKKFSSIVGTSSDYLSKHETDIVTSLAESGAPAGVHNARPYSPSEFEVEEFAAGSILLEGGGLLNFKTVGCEPAERIRHALCRHESGPRAAADGALLHHGPLSGGYQATVFFGWQARGQGLHGPLLPHGKRRKAHPHWQRAVCQARTDAQCRRGDRCVLSFLRGAPRGARRGDHRLTRTFRQRAKIGRL
jgi:predicted dehydrogenase